MAATYRMSLAERERAFVMRQVMAGRCSQKVAAERLGIGVRRMKRLIRLWRAGGDASLISRKRGHASNRTLSPAFHAALEEHLRGQYQGFGPILAAESWRYAMGSRFRRRRCAVARSTWARGGHGRDG